jgi:HJR/Mrr/RecB family endonuclease
LEENHQGKQLIPTSRLVRAVAGAVRHAPTEPFAIVLPQLWTPTAQRIQRLELSDRVGQILREIHDHESSLQQLTPRQLEELIAELLQAKGMHVHVTQYSRDGGRDIVARGELIPGEPCLLAVEIKKKSVVGLADVQRAIYANRFFSALLIATSGRFSAGVVSEKSRPENELRLLLKDGVAIEQWIRLHGLAKGWPSRGSLECDPPLDNDS